MAEASESADACTEIRSRAICLLSAALLGFSNSELRSLREQIDENFVTEIILAAYGSACYSASEAPTIAPGFLRRLEDTIYLHARRRRLSLAKLIRYCVEINRGAISYDQAISAPQIQVIRDFVARAPADDAAKLLQAVAGRKRRLQFRSSEHRPNQPSGVPG